MSAAGSAADADRNAPPASLLVLNASGQRQRVSLDTLPFLIGRQADNNLILRDNRASRNHTRIVVENGHYVIEDLDSRHGTWVNGERVARANLRNSDLIEFGVRDSYQLTFTIETAGFNHLIEQLAVSAHSGDTAANSLVKLRSLVDVARALQNSLSTQEVLTAVVDAALTVTSCERGFLLLRKNGELEITVARDSSGHSLQPGDLRVATSMIRRALESRKDLLTMSFDPLEEAGFRPETTVAALELRSVICLPLIHVRSGSNEDTRVTTAADATAGLVYLDSRKSPADLTSGTREMLQTLAMEASTILENARLIEQERSKQRMEDELKIARDIQQGLLPAALPAAGWFHAAGSSLPATQVGGDYFDVRKISDDRWAAMVADVSGKGVSSALLASLLQGAFMMATGYPVDIGPMMSRWNQFLLERTQGEKYATVFYCTLDSSGLMNYVNAGHCAPFLITEDGRIKKLHTSGMPIGMLEDSVFEVLQVQLQPREKVVIYSDGLTEAENAAGEFFDADRLRLFLRDHIRYEAAALLQSMLDAVDRFSEGGTVRDDVTALVLEYRGPEA